MSNLGFDEITEAREEENANKRIKETPIDRLSVLQDSILVRILSFLYMKEAARTSVLSKRWKYLWIELPKLEFLESRKSGIEIEKTNKFVDLVTKALDNRKRNDLDGIKVSFLYHKRFDSDIDKWIEFLVKNEVKSLSMFLFPYSLLSSYYTMPEIMYSCSSLNSLCLNRCIMSSERKIEWRFLKELLLEDCELNQVLIDEIMSGCPVLCELKLERCCGFDRLEVDSRCLEELRVLQSDDEPYMEISAPYVRVLDVTVFVCGRKCVLENISSVVRVCIDFVELYDDCDEAVMRNADEFVENFKNVEEVRIRHQCFEVLSVMAVNNWKLPQFRLKRLELVSNSEYEHAVSGIIALLEASPNLEMLLLDGYDTDGEIINLDPAAKSDLDCDLNHLKTIRVINFAGSNGEPLLTLARILLRRTPVLEKMMIVVDVEETGDFVNIGQTLLTYPRSSTKAEIHCSLVNEF